MKWYYIDKEGSEVGPFDKQKMLALVRSGEIVDATRIRRADTTSWTTYGRLRQASANRAAAAAPSPARPAAPNGQAPAQRPAPARPGAAARPTPPPAASTEPPARKGKGGVCTECGNPFADEQLISYKDARVCATCKPLFFQKLKEGVAQTAYYVYAGFWIRFVAKIIDSILLGIVNWVLGALVGLMFAASMSNASAENAGPVIGLFVVTNLLSISLAATYSGFFLGKFSATPGKMALGLQVVRPGGEKLTFMRGFGRYFAEILSSMILLIGYIMAAFDEQKRALHDHICDTRVVRK